MAAVRGSTDVEDDVLIGVLADLLRRAVDHPLEGDGAAGDMERHLDRRATGHDRRTDRVATARVGGGGEAQGQTQGDDDARTKCEEPLDRRGHFLSPFYGTREDLR